MPLCVAGLDIPCILKDFPHPVCPYANIVPLYPSVTFWKTNCSIISLLMLYILQFKTIHDISEVTNSLIQANLIESYKLIISCC